MTVANIKAGKYPTRKINCHKLLLHPPVYFAVGSQDKNSLYFKIQTDLKRLKKKLPKAMKAVKLDDRLILVGKSRCTFDGEMKPHPHPQT